VAGDLSGNKADAKNIHIPVFPSEAQAL
jgi:hypothetical protein